eukprot:TRINITY_DN21177_c0_g1_i1.p1 TRINITY_DN21177_c0_g1~~TRINITY_DN21177_c0_g1_i1.p1  ORF type:complete len:312 (+),score=93.18 TRINITY_DN21177_c0_g1_i1:53-937(+)
MAGWMVEIASANIGEEDKKIYRLHLDSNTFIFKTIHYQETNDEPLNRAKAEYSSAINCSTLCMNIAKIVDCHECKNAATKKCVIEMLYEYGNSTILSATLTPVAILSNMLNVADAMIILHKNNVFHSDLRPNTILFEANEVKIIDLGISITFDSRIRHIRSSLRRKKPLRYSYAYYPPEVMAFRDYEPAKVDVYCWGMSRYQLITRKSERELEEETKLFKLSEDNYDQFLEQVKKVKVEKESLSKLLVEILLLTLDSDFKKRPDFAELSSLVRMMAINYKVKLKGIRMVFALGE